MSDNAFDALQHYARDYQPYEDCEFTSSRIYLAVRDVLEFVNEHQTVHGGHQGVHENVRNILAERLSGQ